MKNAAKMRESGKKMQEFVYSDFRAAHLQIVFSFAIFALRS
jgi:hypothetical protein